MRRFLCTAVLIIPTLLTAQAPVRYRYESRTEASKGVSSMIMDMATRMIEAGASDDANSLLSETAEKPVPATSIMAIVSVTTRDSAGGTHVHLAIDSMWSNRFSGVDSLKGKFPADLNDMMASGKGGTFDVFLFHGRQLQRRTSPTMNVNVASLAQMIPLLFPTTPVGAKAGDRWSDTLRDSPRPKTTMGSSDAFDDFFKYTEHTPMNTQWQMATADSLTGKTTGINTRVLGGDWSTRNETVGKHSILFDAQRKVRSATTEVTVTSNDDMMGDKAISTIRTTQTLTRLGGQR